jgi:hypothetical protein
MLPLQVLWRMMDEATVLFRIIVTSKVGVAISSLQESIVSVGVPLPWLRPLWGGRGRFGLRGMIWGWFGNIQILIIACGCSFIVNFISPWSSTRRHMFLCIIILIIPPSSMLFNRGEIFSFA